MDSTTIDLVGGEIEKITTDNDELIIHFSRVIIIKTIHGSSERTKWWQAGRLVFEGAEIESGLPATPCICDGGDVGENIYTYRDMLPVPIQGEGNARCRLKIRDQAELVVANATRLKLDMEDRPHYIEHLRDG